jgi:hypothetical protein
LRENYCSCPICKVRKFFTDTTGAPLFEYKPWPLGRVFFTLFINLFILVFIDVSEGPVTDEERDSDVTAEAAAS